MKRSKVIALLLGPLSAFIIAFALHFSHVGITLGAGIWLIIWWTTEATSLFVTSLVPLVIFPLFGISSLEKTSAAYGDSMIFLFLGGFLIALALERNGLHKRFAFSILKYTSSSVNGILIGFIISTAFLSMWISNTATTMLMLPIALSVITIFQEQKAVSKKDIKHFSVSVLLIISYASSLGGMATLIGTPPNIVFAAFMDKNEHILFGFSDWIKIGLPVSIILLFLMYWAMTRVFFPISIKKLNYSDEFDKLINVKEKLNNSQKITLIIFCTTACLWICKNFINGLFHIQLSDPSIAMLGGLALFVVPTSFIEEKYALNWKDTKDLPFGILFLFGGGIALANAFSEAGILNWIANEVSSVNFSKFDLILILIIITVLLTEVMSNVALVIVFLPIVVALAKGLGIDVLSLAIPVTLAASSGFMLPMSTPPNAIVFASGHLKMKDMYSVGLVLDILSIIVIFLITYFIIPLIHST